MSFITFFFAGALLCNCIPHLVSGLQGEPFPTPFATPHGVGNSSPLLNVLWGFANLVAGLFILSRHPLAPAFGPDAAALLCGALAIGIFSGLHFGRVKRARLTAGTAPLT